VNFSRQMIARDGIAFFPFEDILSTISGGHAWNPVTQSISGRHGENFVEISITDFAYVINGEVLDTHERYIPFIANDRLYVYLEFIIMGLGLETEWCEVTRTLFVR